MARHNHVTKIHQSLIRAYQWKPVHLAQTYDLRSLAVSPLPGLSQLFGSFQAQKKKKEKKENREYFILQKFSAIKVNNHIAS